MKNIFKIAILLCAAVFSQAVFAQGTWTQKANVGGLARAQSFCAAANGKGYVGAGVKWTTSPPQYLTDLWEFDPATNTWTQKANYPGSGKRGGFSFSVGGKVYFGTGITPSVTYVSDFWEYDPTGNTWAQKANFPGGIRIGSFAFDIGTKGYVGGGFDGTNYRNDFYEYDPASNVWTPKTNYGGGPICWASSFVVDGKGYAGVGVTTAGAANVNFYEYSPSTNTWVQKAGFPGTPRQAAKGFSIDGRGYLGAGTLTVAPYGPYLNTFWQYAPTSDSWHQISPFSGGQRGFPIGFSIGSKGYLGAGEVYDSPGLGHSVSDFWEFTPPVDNDNDGYFAGADCNDNNPAIHPGATEIFCNGIDENCDGDPDHEAGNALHFDGSNDKILIGDSPLLSPGVITVEAWVKPDYSGSFRGVVTKRNCCGGATEEWTMQTENGKMGFHALAPGCFVVDPGPLPIGVWTHYAATYDGQTSTLYKNGAVVHQINSTPGSIPDLSWPVYIGDRSGGNDPWPGGIDEVRIWNHARTQAEIYASMNCELTGGEPGLIAYYNFNQGAAGGANGGVTTLNDLSPNNLDGTLQNLNLSGNASNWVASAAIVNGSCSNSPQETCNGLDDDCDGQIDEGIQSTFYADNDGDGFGDLPLTLLGCVAPEGYVSDGTDCDDDNPLVHPEGLEICNLIDDDCDGQVDENVQTVFYQDADGDGFGDASSMTNACAAPSGFVSNSDDCNDAEAAIHPGATEVCNLIDDDCDGQVDENVQTVFYQDADGDGFGNVSNTTLACAAPSGFVSNSDDCNDAEAAIHPGATEVCNLIDDDCDGQVDENVQTVFYQDADGDGFGDASSMTNACAAPSGFVSNSEDCNDASAAIHPGATEICGNNIDENCNGMADDPCPGSCTNSVLTNSGFESGATGWTLSTNVNVTSSNPHSGAKSAKLCGGNGSGSQKKAALPGQNWSASVFADANGSGTDKTVTLRFLNSGNVVLATFSQNVPGETGGYLPFSMVGTAPAATAWAQVYWSKGQGGGCLYVDDWCLQQSPAAIVRPSNGQTIHFETMPLVEKSGGEQASPSPIMGIALSPNPFADLLKLRAEKAATELFQIQVLDLTGKVVAEKAWPVGAQTVEFPSGHWPTGFYLLRVGGAEPKVLRAVKL